MEVVHELLMIGSSACTYRVGTTIVKVPRIDSEAEITLANAKATIVEANVYSILGAHDRIAHCLYISPTKNLIMLEFYPNGNLRDYAASLGSKQICKWAKQMIEGLEFIHRKGVRHSDIRLDQWLVDSESNVHLSDFNAAGHDENTELNLQATKALGNEEPSYFMPRDECEDNTRRSDLFALGSTLYELEYGSAPYAELDGVSITSRFAASDFPSVSGFVLGCIIVGCWEGKYCSAAAMFDEGQRRCGL